MKKNHLTIIFMKDTNRPLTYQISVKLLIFVVILMAGIASTYAFFIRGYYSLYQDNQQLEQIIHTLKTDMGGLQSTINRLSVQDDTSTITEPQPVVQSGATATKMETPQATRDFTGDIAINELAIDANRQTGDIDFSFVLDNKTSDGSLLRGYVFVVLKTSQNNKISSFPDARFDSGKPVDYHRGDRYAIRRFKGYRGELKTSADVISLEILVYSDTGKLVAYIKEPVPAP